MVIASKKINVIKEFINDFQDELKPTLYTCTKEKPIQYHDENNIPGKCISVEEFLNIPFENPYISIYSDALNRFVIDIYIKDKKNDFVAITTFKFRKGFTSATFYSYLRNYLDN